MTDAQPRTTTAPAPVATGRLIPGAARADSVRVIYIAGHSRSGSTLVGSLIGMLDDCCYVGEVVAAWTDGVHGNRNCGCGKPFRDCPFWSVVFDRAYGGFDTPGSSAAEQAIAQLRSPGEALRLWWSIWRHRRISTDTAIYQVALAPLYRAIRDVCGGKVIVDSSKLLRFGALIASMPDVEIRFVNVVRDVRGVVQSRARPALMRDGDVRHADASGEPRYRIVRVVSRWIGRNEFSMRLIDAFGGLRVPYEEFARDPIPILAELADAESAARAMRGLEGRTESRPAQHQLGGNWVRDLRLEPRQTWQQELPRSVRVATTALAWPFLRRYRFESRHPGGLLPGRKGETPQ